MANARNPILLLDPLRLVAALMVMAHHYASILPTHPPQFLAEARIARPLTAVSVSWFDAGWIGVEVFFVLSGYVIALSGDRDGGGGGVGARAFLRRRALRLAPAAWICATLTAVVLCLVADGRGVTLAWLRALAFIPWWRLIDGSYWTLSIELAFYASVAAWIAIGARLERLAMLLAVASAAYWLAPVAHTDTVMWNLTLLPHGCFFALGMTLFAARSAGWRRREIAVAALASLAGVLQILDRAGVMAAQSGTSGDALMPLALLALAVMAIARADAAEGPLARIGAARLRTLGLMTYPLYLLHQNIGAVAIFALVATGVPDAGAMILTAAAMIALAAFVALRIEPDVRRVLAMLLGYRRPSYRGPVRYNRPSASLRAG